MPLLAKISHSLLMLLFTLSPVARDCCSIFFGQNVPPAGGAAPSSFAYVASSVTGCTTTGAALTAGTCVFALHANPGTGNLLVCAAFWPGTITTYTMTGSNNGSLTAVGSPQAGIGSLSTFWGQNFYKFSTVSGAETITGQTSAAVGSVSGWECNFYTYSGTLSALDGTAQYSNTVASGTTATISGLTTSNASDLIWVSCNAVNTTCSVGSGYTARNDASSCLWNGTSCTTQNYETNTGGLIEEKVNVAAGAQTATFVVGSGDDVILGLVGF